MSVDRDADQQQIDVRLAMRRGIERCVAAKVLKRPLNASKIGREEGVPAEQLANFRRKVAACAKCPVFVAFVKASAVEPECEPKPAQSSGKAAVPKLRTLEELNYEAKYKEAGRRTNAAEPESISRVATALKLNWRTVSAAKMRTQKLRLAENDPTAVAMPPLRTGQPWIPDSFEKLVAMHVAMYRADKQRVSREEVMAMMDALIQDTPGIMAKFPDGHVGLSWFEGWMKRWNFSPNARRVGQWWCANCQELYEESGGKIEFWDDADLAEQRTTWAAAAAAK